MYVFAPNGQYAGKVTGVYEYTDDVVYTEGDLVIDTDTNEMFVCIKDLPTAGAKAYFTNPDYFRPFWYLYAIRDLNTYVSSVSSSQTEQPVLKRVLDAVLERKFGTGLIIADEAVHGTSVDLNEIVHTGRYIVYIKSSTSIKKSS